MGIELQTSIVGVNRTIKCVKTNLPFQPFPHLFYEYNKRANWAANAVEFGDNLFPIIRGFGLNNEQDLIVFPSGYRLTAKYRSEETDGINFKWYDPNNNMLFQRSASYGGNSDLPHPREFYIALGVDYDAHKAYIYAFYTQASYYVWAIDEGPLMQGNEPITDSLMYNIVFGSEPIIYNYVPIAYCRSPYSHRNFAMIKGTYTAHGDPQTTVSQDHFVRVGDSDVPQPGDNLTKLVDGLVVNAEKMIAWAGPNGLGVKRNSDVGSDKSYTLKYYFSGVHDATLDHSITVSGLQRYFLSYLYDVTENVMRPSIIKYDPLTPLTIWSYNNETVSHAQQERYRQWFGLNYGITIPDSPGYWNDEASPVAPDSGDPGSGQGVEDRTTAGVQPPATLPGVNALDTNFVTIWSPSLAEMKNLSNYMWNTLDLTQWRKLFADPMDCILACYMYPLTNLQVRGTPTPSTADVNVGNISTGVEMHLVDDQFISLSYGTLHIDRQTNSYMDFAPYTKCSLYLPYIGIVALDVDEIMGKDINLTYNIDLMTGTCLAMLTCETTDGSDVLYQWAGNCAIPIPMTSASFDTVIKNSLSVLGTTTAAVCGIASGGTAAVMGGIGAAQSLANVSNSKPEIGRSGALGSNASFLGPQDAYLIWQYPNEWRADNQNAIEGYPLYATETLSSLEGFTKVLDMHLEGMSCTQTEADEIMQLLKEGVII